MNSFLRRLGVDNPIVLAPLGGGPCTPELVAAVANAGGLATLAAAYLTPEQITADMRRIRALTGKPIAVNLFAGGYNLPDRLPESAPMLSLLSEIHAELGLPAPSLPENVTDPFPKQFEAVIAARPAAFSFIFGIPSREDMDRLKQLGILIIGTATTVEEARLLEQAGADAVIAQGAEAGAHRGTFARSWQESMVPTFQLVRDVRAAIKLPVIATGGIMDGEDIAAALAAGASAAQLGTAFLASPETAIPDAYRQALLNARSDTTVITRAFSGRPARGLVNDFIRRLKGKEDAILPYPIQNALTRAMRTAAGKQGRADFLSLWAGTGVTRIRPMPAGDLVRLLVREMNEALPKFPGVESRIA